MVEFNGTTSFNGKQIKAAYMAGWGEPGLWQITDENNEYMIVYNVEPYKQTQEQSLEYLLGRATENTQDSEEFEGRIREIFKSNWQTHGSNEDVVKLCLQYVEYNDASEKEDLANLASLTTQIALSIEDLASSVRGDVFNYNVFEPALKQQKILWNALSLRLDVIRQRLDVYSKMKAGEQVGLGWTNETYFEAVKGTAVETMVRRILGSRIANLA
jgi:hypothetical protein